MLHYVVFTKVFKEGTLAGIPLTDQGLPYSTAEGAAKAAAFYRREIRLGKSFRDCVTGNCYDVTDVRIKTRA